MTLSAMVGEGHAPLWQYFSPLLRGRRGDRCPKAANHGTYAVSAAKPCFLGRNGAIWRYGPRQLRHSRAPERSRSWSAGSIASACGEEAAWFTHPDGNVIGVGAS
jgi:hypothetical protein